MLKGKASSQMSHLKGFSSLGAFSKFHALHDSTHYLSFCPHEKARAFTLNESFDDFLDELIE